MVAAGVVASDRSSPKEPSIEPALHPRPLKEVIPAAMEQQGLTYRGLAEKTRTADPRGRGFTHAYLNQVGRGLEQPARGAITIIAAALDVPLSSITEAIAAAVADEFNYRSRDPAQLQQNVEQLLALVDARPGDHDVGFVRTLRELRR